MTPAAGKSVLLVEDDALVGAVLREMLSALGYRVLDVARGAEAIRIIEGDSPLDILLTDLSLPGGISGLAIIKSANQHRPGVRRVLMSGFLSGQEASELDLLADVQLLPKPFTLGQLREVLGP
ncbi:MAG: hypothetical protein C0454_08620 [Parvibaculum sp.]|nr:hypothetical protein [Parvibaculum sp.]